MALDSSSKLGELLGKTIKEQHDIEENIDGVEEGSALNFETRNVLRLKEHIKLYKRPLPNAFVMDHPKLGYLGGVTYLDTTEYDYVFSFEDNLTNSNNTAQTFSGSATYAEEDGITHAVAEDLSFIPPSSTGSTWAFLVRTRYGGSDASLMSFGSLSSVRIALSYVGSILRIVYQSKVPHPSIPGAWIVGPVTVDALTIASGWQDIIVQTNDTTFTILYDGQTVTRSDLYPITTSRLYPRAAEYRAIVGKIGSIFSEEEIALFSETTFEEEQPPTGVDPLPFDQGYPTDTLTMNVTMPIKLGSTKILIYDSEA